ncbi:hypothetical protein C8D93_102385 [Sinimarinibacterium flocculans]|uniref:Uncharacterized protein n=2 Tax=Sinimarinibacterium flocculans TaxID=985250 RepID=A0A318EIT7_9GAMM|nr:hypothetical protein C8D93_102385 [Sinimarinibacterium flocculans]
MLHRHKHDMTTIREQLRRQVRRSMAAVFATWLVFAGIGVVGIGQGLNPVFAFGTFALFMGAVLYATLFIKCPRCGFKLAQGSMGLAFGEPGRGNKRSINFCAHCGVSFDERL